MSYLMKSKSHSKQGNSLRSVCLKCEGRRMDQTGRGHLMQDVNSTATNGANEEDEDSESAISSEGFDMNEAINIGTQEGNSQESTLQVQEIWFRRDIRDCLNAMPGGQEIQNAIASGNLQQAASHPNASHTGLFIASFLGKDELLRLILQNKFPVNIRDPEGRTPLHLAASAAAENCVKILLENQAMPNVWDKAGLVTPLHCAASAGSLTCLILLIEAGACIDAGVTSTGSGKSALHYAVQSNSVSCVEELLKRGACPNISQVYTETPLHVAAAMGYFNCVKMLLENGADFRVRCGPVKATALHLAAEDGNAECTKLLLDVGADINARTSKNQTPLHLAALAQSAQTLELLLKKQADPNAEDTDKRTPLHCAIVKSSRSCECVQILLRNGAKVNAADVFGYTPVHISALNEFSHCLKLLLDYGGDVTKRTNGNVSALSFIVRRTPEILPYIECKLDESISLHDHEIGDVDCEIKLDFRILVPNKSSGETGLLLTLIEVGQRQMLKHPLCEIFLHLKWRRIRKYFVFSLLIHACYLTLCSTYITGVFLNPCNGSLACAMPETFKQLNYIILTCNISILSKEIFQIAHTRKGYIYQWENWLQWFIILTVFFTLVPPNWLPINVYTWQHHVSVFGMFFNWIELMVLIGRFPMFGLYVQMFTTGAVNFGKFLLAYFCLLSGFVFSFRMLFPNYPSFSTISNSAVKVIAMMTGELEFEDIFFQDEPVTYPGTAHLFFLLFMLIVTMVLSNLLVGLSVSDIQGLQKSAGLDRLIRQAELVAYMESMLFSRLLHWIPDKVLKICHRSALLFNSPRQYTLIIRPNDPREKRIPAELVKSAYQTVFQSRHICTKGRQSRKRNSPSFFKNHVYHNFLREMHYMRNEFV